MVGFGNNNLFSLLIIICFFTSSCKKGTVENPLPIDAVADIDGNIYHFDTIGSQIWMLENLKTTRYRNGDNIPYVADTNVWTKLKTAAYCNSHNSDSLANIYGRLYNWYAATYPCGICPEGWHVASYPEWMELVNYLGGDKIAGWKLRETGTIHWTFNYNATNESGFTALPGGYRSEYNGWYNSLGLYGFWWTGTEQDSLWAVYCRIFYSDGSFYRNLEVKDAGFSLRCIKD
jgi:uncharacterized protein (TIGR02145 family)